MNKRIIIYRWGALGEQTLIRNMIKTGAECIEFTRKMQDYHNDGGFSEEMLSVIHSEHIDGVFSYDYFPLISMLCDMNNIPYISWIYDCPMTTLMSKTMTNEWNYIFCFDTLYTQKLADMGAKHVFHCPLAVEEDVLENILMEEKDSCKDLQKVHRENPVDFYSSKLSFVGNLYNGEKNRLRQAELSEYAHGYVEGLICSQLLVYGYNLLSDSLTTQVVDEIADKCELKLSERYTCDTRQMAADAIGVEVTAREREQILKILSDKYPLTLYSSCPVDKKIRGTYLQEKGYADYETEMPYIFHNSKINLNITSRTIQSGIPQRVLDILACGGFCLTNYQPEIAEYFEDGVELVMYSGLADLVTKVDYYLKHEQERKQIAENGNGKVKEFFSLEKSLGEILEAVFEK